MLKTKVIVSRKYAKQFEKLPKNIKECVLLWIRYVEYEGPEAIKRMRGYRDKPLKGERKGQRSIRLNRAYRLIYTALESEKTHFIKILEVHKHDY